LSAIKAQLVLKKHVSAAEIESLYTPFAARPGMTIGLPAVGWGDSLPRSVSGGSALIRGRRVPIVGPVHVEHVRIDLSACPEAKVGDEVVLAGRQGAEVIDVADIASKWNVGMTEFICGHRDHVPRFYVRSGQLSYDDGVPISERDL
jgi:alanine racemase